MLSFVSGLVSFVIMAIIIYLILTHIDVLNNIRNVFDEQHITANITRPFAHNVKVSNASPTLVGAPTIFMPPTTASQERVITSTPQPFERITGSPLTSSMSLSGSTYSPVPA